MARSKNWSKASPEACYAEAQRLIAEHADSADRIDLDLSHLKALAEIPPEISERTALETLDLENTLVSDITLLTELTTLKGLDLGNTSVYDITPLAGLAKLETLLLNHTSVSDITPLAELTALETLWLSNTSVSDITPLAGLAKLEMLLLHHTSVSDITPLAALTSLERLDLENTSVSDLTPLAELTALKWLYLDNTSVSDITPLAELTALKTLALSNTSVSDITSLAGLAKLEMLLLHHTSVSDITPLAELTTLKGLTLENTLVSDITPLVGFNASNPGGFGRITIQGIRALDHDPRLAEIAEISDDKERTIQLIEYINSPEYTPPHEPESKPEPEPEQHIGPIQVVFNQRENKFVYRPPHADDSSDVLRLAWNGLGKLANNLHSLAQKPNNNPNLPIAIGQYAEELNEPYDSRNDIQLYLAAGWLNQVLKSAEDELDDIFKAGLVNLIRQHETYIAQSAIVQEYIKDVQKLKEKDAQGTKVLAQLWGEMRQCDGVFSEDLSKRVDHLAQSARINAIEQSARIDAIEQSARIDAIEQSARIDALETRRETPNNNTSTKGDTESISSTRHGLAVSVGNILAEAFKKFVNAAATSAGRVIGTATGVTAVVTLVVYLSNLPNISQWITVLQASEHYVWIAQLLKGLL